MAPYNLNYLTTLDGAYRHCYQVIVAPYYHKDACDPSGFGSGFVLEVGRQKYFITADHVTSWHNFPDFESWGNDSICCVLSGENDEKLRVHKCVNLTGRFEFLKFEKPREKEDIVFPETVDLTFCETPALLDSCITLGFVIPHSIIAFSAGSSKLAFKECDIIHEQDLNSSHYFVIGNIIGFNPNSLEGVKKDKLHSSLEFIENSDDEYVLRSPSIIARNSDWAGLSGSPVISDDGKLLGMLLRVCDGNHFVYVKPMASVLKKTKMVQRLSSKINLNEPFFVVGLGTTMEDIENNPAVAEVVAKLEKNKRSN